MRRIAGRGRILQEETEERERKRAATTKRRPPEMGEAALRVHR
jgi:hypothetical protein